MKDCLFCKMVSGEVPCFKIYEDDLFLAFLDAFPLVTGHTMVIPKKHFRWVWDVEPGGKYFEVIQKIAKHFQEITEKEYVYSITIGEGVPHAHYHIIPDDENIGKVLDRYSELKSNNILQAEEAKPIVEKFKLKD